MQEKAIVEFNKRFPEVEIEIVSGTHDELGNKVFNNDWKKENTNPVISDFANILKEMFNQE